MTSNDRLIGLILIGLGTLMLYQVYLLEFPQFLDDPGPQLMPNIIGALLILCGLGHLVWPKAEKQAINNLEKKDLDKTKGTKKILYIGISLVVYTSILEVTGYIISTFLFLTFSIWFLTEGKNKSTIIKSGAVSIVITLSVYFVFRNLIGIILPSGIF